MTLLTKIDIVVSMLDTWFDGSQVNLLIAFTAGLTTFFASCLLPLVPTYLAYLSGVSLTSQTKPTQKTTDTTTNEPTCTTTLSRTQRWIIFKTALAFVTGFVLAFTILGLSVNQLNGLLHPYKSLIEKAGGLLFIVMGLFMIGILKNNVLNKEFRFHAHNVFHKYKYVHAFIMGIAFGVGWTPCIGPVLAVILFWASQAETAWYGSLLLTTYGIGLGTPFLIIALGFEKIFPLLKKYRSVTRYVTYIAGIIIIIAGFLMILGQFKTASILLLHWLNVRTHSI